MGSIAVQPSAIVESANRCEPGSFPLVTAKYPAASGANPADPDQVASQWVTAFNDAIGKPDIAPICKLFLEESFWRDQLCLTWDFHTLHGPKKIVELLTNSKSAPRIKSIALDKSSAYRSPKTVTLDSEGNVPGIQAFLSVETNVGRGEGLVVLAHEENVWKSFTLFTYLKELKGHEETVGKRRSMGVEHGTHTSQENWLDRRKAEEKMEHEEPAVLIVGAGQSGLTIAARLKALGVKSLIVDREERIGDNWRTRYHQLVLHDCVYFDHLPYLPFPETWPVFTPKDKLGDWFESYVKLLELNAWTQTSISKSSWDEKETKWTITLDRIVDGKTQTRVVHPRHVIQATGASGVPNFPSDINGLSSFSGTVAHSSKYKGALPSHGQNKRAIVVGCCNSGHDIAQDLYENGYSVTMVQRSTTLVLNAETNLMDMAGLYGEDSPPNSDSDVIFWSKPNPVAKRGNIDMTKKQNKVDEKTLLGLEKAGFKVDSGPDDSGLWIKYLQRGGGYYIDVGCSQLIIDGKIKIKQGCEIKEIVPDGVIFSDGEKLEADEIVFATGYQNMRTQCRNIFGDEIADQVKDVWGFNEEGELRTIWQKSGHQGFWFMGGNLAMCRWYSRSLALQIKGLEENLYKYEDS